MMAILIAIQIKRGVKKFFPELKRRKRKCPEFDIFGALKCLCF